MAEQTDGSGHASIEGSMLSADISGFTALSERLADKGREGAEELTRLINACFVALIDAAYGYGGEVLKFGGDAVLLMFRGDSHERRAGRAAQAMQLALRSTTAARRSHLTMTVGVAEGPFDAFLVGTGSRDLLISGRAATEVIRLESTAEQGETLASSAIADALDHRAPDGTSVIWDHPTPPVARTIRTEDLTPFVPGPVAEQLTAFSDVGGEHRLVAIGFVSVTGVEQALKTLGGPETAVQLGRLLDHVHASCSGYDVTVLHSDIAEDGFKLVLCAGAPLATATPGDAMLQAALQIATTDAPLVVKQGVQVGRVFAGFLGSEYRRTYTLMGDPVNTAARMLGQAADRDIIAVHDVVLETRSIFIDEELEPFTVKGKIAPIIAHRILEATDEVRRRGDWITFVGRQDELAQINSAVTSGGAILDLVGPGGSGKTRLIEETADRVDVDGYLRFQAVCSPYGGTAPYSLMRMLFRNGLGVDMHLDDGSTGELLTKVVRQFAPALAPMLPLLALAIGATVESTPEYEALAPENRRDRMHDAVIEFLAEAFDRPIAILAEDIHWIDHASRDLLAHLATQADRRGWLVATTRRPEGDALVDDTQDRTTIEVGPLDSDSIRAIVLGNAAASLNDQQVAAVIDRADGNPLFAIELARIITSGAGDHLPDSVEKLVTARLDQLPPDARRFLRIASVVGVEMDEPDLLGILAAEAPNLQPPWDDVAEFLHRRADGTVAFSNIVFHDAAYEGLPFKTRRRIHKAIGEFIEYRAKDPNKFAALLARHFSEAREHPRAWHYGKAAGDGAVAEGAHVEATSNYGRALASARYVRDLSAGKIAELAMRLGDSHLVVGQFEEARTAWQHARNKTDQHTVETAIMRNFGTVEQQQGRLDAALRWLSKAEGLIADQIDTPNGADELTRILTARASVYIRQGRFEETVTTANRAIEASVNDRHARADALDRLQLAEAYLRNPTADAIGAEALEIFDELGDYAGKARVLNNMGVGAYFRGDWDSAARYYAQSVDEGLKAGALVDGVVGGLNAGEVLSDQGRWDEAQDQLESALRNWQSVGYPVGVAAAQLFLGVVLRRQGNWRDARETLGQAIEAITELGVGELLADAQTRQCEIDVYSRKPDPDELARLLIEFGPDHPLTPRLRRLQAISSYLGGDADAALRELDELLVDVTGFDRLLTLRTHVHIGPDGEAAEAMQAEADEIAADLGVVQTARLPRP